MGQDEDEPALRTKVEWYKRHGVAVVWLLLPESRAVLVLSEASESRHGLGERLPEVLRLPGLTPNVDSLFAQLER